MNKSEKMRPLETRIVVRGHVTSQSHWNLSLIGVYWGFSQIYM